MEPYRQRDHLEYPEMTMFEMVRQAAENAPDMPAYEFFNKKTSYRRFIAKIERTARALLAEGVNAGDAVTICMPNTPQALDAFYAINRIGAVANMVHPQSAVNEIAFYLSLTKSRYILTFDLFYENVKSAVEKVGYPVQVIVTRMQDELPPHMALAFSATKGRAAMKFPGRDGGILWKKFLQKGEGKNAPKLPEISFDKNRTSVILYSGGTSGIPKGIRLSDFNFNALSCQAAEAIGVDLGAGRTMLSCMPVFHGFGLGINIHTILTHGAECILMPAFNIKSYAEMMIRKKPNFLAGVPTIFEALLHMPQLDGKDLSFLMGMFCGGDSLSVELKKKVDTFLREHNARIQVREGYGLTECVTASCLTPRDEYREGSIGIPFPDTLYCIVKPGTDEELPRGEEGEIIISGPTVMLGYYDNPSENAETLRTLSDGRIWMYSGDLGYMDEDGFVYFRQRLKRMIITNGYNVYPSILENAIDAVPEVAYSCVIGVPDRKRMHRIRAYVVPRDGIEGDDALKQKIMDEMRLHVAAYALPREIIFRKELPKTLVGKVAYRKLEEEAENEVGKE